MKKLIAFVLAALLVAASLSGCAKKKQTLKVGASPTPHAEILAQVKDTLAKEGYDLEIQEFSDYVIPNTSLESGDLDANYFQHKPYMDQFNADNGTHLVSVAAIHYEPMGIFAGKSKALADLPDGGSIAVPNDATNEARALMLLEANGVLKLKEGVGLKATKLDVAENPKNIDIVEVEAAQLVNDLPDVDFAVINGNYAIQGGLKVADALAIESADSEAAKTYANIIAVKEGHEKDPGIQALVKALQSDAVKKYINDTYAGAVVPIF
jgi:D-methionine transport system substrate-binding protein